MRKNGRFLLCVVILGLIIISSTLGTAMSCNACPGDIRKADYRQMEQEYVQQVRTFLDDSGYGNSGVMLTYVTDGEGSRIYTVTIHHERLESLSFTEKQEIGKAILALAFEAPDCAFCQEFLVA